MTALAIPRISELATEVGIDEAVVLLAAAIDDLDDVAELHSWADQVEVVIAAARLRNEHEAARRAVGQLERLALHAQLRMGELLAALDPGQKGKPKSERTIVAEQAGLDRREAKTLVDLAKLDKPAVIEAVERVETEGRRATPTTVLKAAASANTGRGESDECYTPQAVVDLAIKVFGGRPDCDPATSAVAQTRVGARMWWSAAEPVLGPAEKAAGLRRASFDRLMLTWAGVGELLDGVEPIRRKDGETDKAWARRQNEATLGCAARLEGKVWANAPYSCPRPWAVAVVERWLGQAVGDAPLEQLRERSADIASGRAVDDGHGITEAIVLLNTATGTAAQQLLLAVAQAACWPEGRMSFDGADGKPIGTSNRYEQVIFYLGPNTATFAEVFGSIGVVTFGAVKR